MRRADAQRSDVHGSFVAVASVYDIAAGIQARLGQVDQFRLNKLLYYVQAWSLVHQDRPAFNARIEAWVNGPVARELWVDWKYNDSRKLAAGSAAYLSPDDIAAIDQVLIHFGQMSSGELIKLTHDEAPWKSARGNLPAHAQSNAEITHDAIREYYARAWREADEDNRAAMAPPAFAGSVDDLAALLNG